MQLRSESGVKLMPPAIPVGPMIGQRLLAGHKPGQIAREIGCHYNTVYNVKTGHRWSDVEPEGHG